MLGLQPVTTPDFLPLITTETWPSLAVMTQVFHWPAGFERSRTISLFSDLEAPLGKMLPAVGPGVMDSRVHGLPTQLARGVAEQCRPGFIEERTVPILIDADQAIGGASQDRAHVSTYRHGFQPTLCLAPSEILEIQANQHQSDRAQDGQANGAEPGPKLPRTPPLKTGLRQGRVTDQ